MIDPSLVATISVIVQALATIVLVGVTAFYAYLTNRSVKASEKMAEVMVKQRHRIKEKGILLNELKLNTWPSFGAQMKDIAEKMKYDMIELQLIFCELQLDGLVGSDSEGRWILKK